MAAQLLSTSSASPAVAGSLTPFAVEVPNCSPVVCIALKALGGLVLGLGVGALIATVFSIPFIVAGSVMATIGFIAGLIYGFYSRPLPPLAQYYLKTIDQLEQALPPGTVKTALLEIKPILAQPPRPIFEQNYHLHTLHDRLTIITGEATQSPAIQNVWKCFLERLHNYPMQMPDGLIHHLDTRFELKRLGGEKIHYDVRNVFSTNSDFDTVLAKIVELEKVCFGRCGTFPLEKLKEPNKYEFLIAESTQGEVLGFAYFTEVEEKDKSKTLHLCGLARDPGASRLGIGETLLKAAFAWFSDRAFSLEVRESHVKARKLYENTGFIYGEKKPNYYNEPIEDAISMRRPVDGEALLSTG